ncbi:MAG: restriction endonuclease subunit S [Nonlabens sp.]
MGKRILGLDLGTSSIGWTLVELDTVTKVLGGGTPKTSVNDYWGNDIIWVSPTDLPEIGKITSIITSKKKISTLGLSKSSAKLLPKGTVLFSSRASIGKIGIAEKEVCTNQGFTNFICDEKILSNYFLAYCLKYNIRNITALSNSTTFKEISKTAIKKFKIPLPPLAEQQRIVSRLDALFEKIDRAIALLEENIAHTQSLMGSVLDGEFMDIQKNFETLNKLSTKIGSGSTPRGGQKSYKKQGISLIRSMNVHDNYFKIKNLAFIDDDQATKLKNVEVYEDDVLLNITGASVARCCIVDSSYLPARVNQHVSIIRTSSSLLPKFLLYYLISPTVKNKLLQDASGNATREAITKTMIQSFKVPVPSIAQQREHIKKIDSSFRITNKLKEQQTQKLEGLHALKGSLLDGVFKGGGKKKGVEWFLTRR